jgi:hypothetical protein
MTRFNGEALNCEGTGPTLPACLWRDIDPLRAFINPIASIINFFQSVASLVLAWSYKAFANMPQEQLEKVKGRDRIQSLQGFICMKGPWLTRLLHFFNLTSTIIFLLIFWGLRSCKYELNTTKPCAEFRNECVFNQVKNCIFWHQYCSGAYGERAAENNENHIRCLDPDFRDPNAKGDQVTTYDLGEGQEAHFTFGLFDIRVMKNELSTDEMCKIVAGALKIRDFLPANSTMEGKLVNHLDKSCNDGTLSQTSEEHMEIMMQTSLGRGKYSTMNNPGTENTIDDPDAVESGCENSQSFIHLLLQMYSIIIIICLIVLSLLGQILRRISRPEPYFHAPAEKKERWPKKLLRRCAP